jgi:Domain of unknown function (DUF4835)
MRKTLLIIALPLIVLTRLGAQELNATVRITAPKLQTVDPQVFKTMERAILEFMNNTRWDVNDYAMEERIECAFQINILEELSSNVFKADIAFQAVRPVFKSDYKSPLVSHVDRNVIITYEEYQPIEESRDSYNDNLSSVLTYYAYTILGYDNDSFSSLGGDPYYQIAQNIITNIPPAVLEADKGWGSLNNRNNRFWIIENMLSPKMREYRLAMYQYHRHGLDYMAADISKGQTEMLNALTSIDKVRAAYPNSMVLRMFATTKSDEIIEIFKGADRTTKNTVYQIMRKVDVANASKYNVLRS